MPNRNSRFIFPPLALLVSALIGCTAKHMTDEPLCPGDAIIRVDKEGKVNRLKVTLDKRCNDVAFWVSDDRNKNLFIEFDQNGPFEAMTPSGKRWRVHCKDGNCFSGDIQPEAVGGGKEYKYWQVLENQDATGRIEVDGWIVIKP